MEFRLLHQSLALVIIICSLTTLASSLESVTPSIDAIKKTEVQWALCESSVSQFARKTGFPLKSSEKRQVYFLETTNMDLFALKTVLRIRDADRTFQTSAKINFVDDSNLPWQELRGKDSKCEWDRYGSFQKVGCSLNHEATALTSALSREQQSYVQTITGFNAWKDLRLLGPANDEEWTWEQGPTGTELSLEEISAGGFTSLELSARVKNADADRVQTQIQSWLEQNQVTLCPLQRGKSEDLIRALLAK